MDDRKTTGTSGAVERRDRFAGWRAVLIAFAAFELTQVLVESYWGRGVRQRIDLVIVGAIAMGFGIAGVLRRSRRRRATTNE